MQLTAEHVKALTTQELIAKYNELTGKSIKRFATRAKGEAQVIKASAGNGILIHTGNANTAAVNAAARVARKSGKKRVRNTTGVKLGRPKASFTVQLLSTTAITKPHGESMRMKLIKHLESCDGKSASIEAIDKKFSRNMRGVVNKLKEVKWVKITGKE